MDNNMFSCQHKWWEFMQPDETGGFLKCDRCKEIVFLPREEWDKYQKALQEHGPDAIEIIEHKNK